MAKPFQPNSAYTSNCEIDVSFSFDSEHRFWTAKDVETDTVDKVGFSQIETFHNAGIKE